MTTVSIFALNITTALGLGLAIDYSLFVVSRYREERAAGQPHRPGGGAHRGHRRSRRRVQRPQSPCRCPALLVFPIAFLRSFAYAGIPVVALAVAGAVVVLPALLALLGDRVDARSRCPRADDSPSTGRFWHRPPPR